MVGPNAFAVGWWIVKKLEGNRLQGGAYTVPEAEIVRVLHSP